MEILESAVADPATVAPVLERISDLGVRIAIDDFGAGFSSLARPMPVADVTELLQSGSGRGGAPSRASRQGT
jgi:predicted signal transduction protein with EAL and GGDEF domain